jgi:superfamily I DNA/RNA helicase
MKTFPATAGLQDDFAILDVAERRQLIGKYVLSQQRFRYFSEDELLENITKVKNGMVLFADLPVDVQSALSLYERIMREQNAIDLDDMVVKALKCPGSASSHRSTLL